MRRRKHLEGYILLAFTYVLTSCASTTLDPIGAGGKPFRIEEDEQQLWRSGEQIERLFDNSEFLYKDERLESYLNRVAQKLSNPNAQLGAPTPRIKVIRHPFLNAFAMPHGVIYLHTGLLARMENEAQLATILGHELTHFAHRHAVKEMRQAENKQAVVGALQLMLVTAGTVFVGPVGPMLGDLTGQVGVIWTLASVRGYSRDLETEADEEGLRAVVRAGYDPTEAPKVFEHFQQELDERKIKEPFFFGTHPRLQERIESYQRLLGTQYAAHVMEGERVKSTEEYLNRVNWLLLDNAVLDLEIGRFRTAEAAIDKHLQKNPGSARAYFLLGEVHRRSGRDELHTQRAMAAYQHAVQIDPLYADPHRELGLLYRAQNNHKQAHAEFERYLTLNPKAIDAPIIKKYLTESRWP